jgi:S-adenosylmethionine decarboxylase proenzyme
MILELWDASNTNSAETMERVLRKACATGKIDLSKIVVHRFSPYGVSGIAVIAEAHIAIHTWPEYSFAAVDIFSSSEVADLDRIAEVIKAAFSPCQVNQVEIKRGTHHPLAR